MVSSVLIKSGFEYTHHEQFFNLRLALERARVERHLGLVYELRHVVERQHTMRVCALSEAAQYRPFVHAMLEHYELTCVCGVTNAHDLLYLLPGTPLPRILHDSCACVLAHQDTELSSRFVRFGWTDTDYILNVRLDVEAPFRAHFHHRLDGNTLRFDNLINLCIMVKDAGPLFEQVLRENIQYADVWTVLDTGSTDETLDIIDRVLTRGPTPGQLHQEPFVNFRDSRNRCLDLAGKACKYNIMLDDTYIVRGGVRAFLHTVRGDEFGSSFSFYIQSGDTEYTTNRVTRTDLPLRYRFLIHEVLTDENNVNVLIPQPVAWIEDLRAPYMEQRTMARKQYDLELLHQSVREEPDEPRHLYYLAQTYTLLDDTDNAAKYFELRAADPHGFHQERVDACFELARTMQFKQGRPWSEVEPVYLKVLELEPQRVDAMYFLGIYHIFDGRTNGDAAFPWLQRAFALGYSTATQYSLKPTLVYYFLPSFLAPLCYARNQWQLGLAACDRFFSELNSAAVAAIAEPTTVHSMASWRDVYRSLVKLQAMQQPALAAVRHIDVLFVVDGNWSAWTGADIESKGLGGSETWAVNLATEWKRQHPGAVVLVLCNCATASTYHSVEFAPITGFEQVMLTHSVGTCIVSRFSHYLFAPVHTRCNKLLLFLHDLGPSGNLLPVHPKLQHVFCLSDWHAALVSANFPSHASRVRTLGYGIDATRWQPGVKTHHSFIYSSFPDRGLLYLLRMWPSIRTMWPDATLQVFCDLQHDHVRRVNGPMMEAIDGLLAGESAQGVHVRGWVSKPELAKAWAAAEYWLYPNVFDETFCLTALECCSTGTIGIAPPKAGLQHFPLLLVDGDASSTQWATDVLTLLAGLDTTAQQECVEKGLRHARSQTWGAKVKHLCLGGKEHHE